MNANRNHLRRCRHWCWCGTGGVTGGAGKGDSKDVDLAEKPGTTVFEEAEGAGEHRAPRNLHLMFFLILSLAGLPHTLEPLFEERGYSCMFDLPDETLPSLSASRFSHFEVGGRRANSMFSSIHPFLFSVLRFRWPFDNCHHRLHHYLSYF